MLTMKTVFAQIGRMSIMRYFPADPDARDAIAAMIGEMATSDEQVIWLAARMIQCYSEWPGHMELRACFCSRYKPADGVEAISQAYFEREMPPEAPGGRKLATRESLRIQGFVPPDDIDTGFPTDAFSLLAAAGKKLRAPGAEPVRQSEIDRIKAIQESNWERRGAK
jgi:hypothetical protein